MEAICAIQLRCDCREGRLQWSIMEGLDGGG